MFLDPALVGIVCLLRKNSETLAYGNVTMCTPCVVYVKRCPECPPLVSLVSYPWLCCSACQGTDVLSVVVHAALVTSTGRKLIPMHISSISYRLADRTVERQMDNCQARNAVPPRCQEVYNKSKSSRVLPRPVIHSVEVVVERNLTVSS